MNVRSLNKRTKISDGEHSQASGDAAGKVSKAGEASEASKAGEGKVSKAGEAGKVSKAGEASEASKVSKAGKVSKVSKASAKSREKAPGRPVSGDKRREILDAGLRVFAWRGYHGTSVPEVAHAAKVAVGSLYRYFENKDALINEVYRDAKIRLRAAMFVPDLPSLESYEATAGRVWFEELWRRLGAFAKAEPDAFRFLEMQDHAPYLDATSRQLELAILAPMWVAGKRLNDRAANSPASVEILIALLWGAFVGLVKAGRLGYLTVDDKAFTRAGAACWRMIVPEASRAASSARPTQRARASKGSS